MKEQRWKQGDMNYLKDLIMEIKKVEQCKSLSDEYLSSINHSTRAEYNVAEEKDYGIVWVLADYVLPYLEQLNQVNNKSNEAPFSENLGKIYMKLWGTS